MAAIATDCADIVLSSQAILQAIENYVKDGTLELLTDTRSDELTEDYLIRSSAQSKEICHSILLTTSGQRLSEGLEKDW